MQPPVPSYSWRNVHPTAKYHYIRDAHQANTLVALLQGPVGFDLEWKPTFRKGAPENPISLVQLANQELILLIQVGAMRGKALSTPYSINQLDRVLAEFPAKLQEFLENSDSVKVGVGIQGEHDLFGSAEFDQIYIASR